MIELVLGFLARVAVMVPVIVVTAALMWWLGARLGWTRPEGPFDARDMRTWPLGYALADATAFALIFAAVSAAAGDGEMAVALAAGIAAAIAIGVVPRILPAPR